MCIQCKALKPLSIGLLPIEKVTATGCDELWKTWCSQNREVIEKEVSQWLKDNTFVLRILDLGNLSKMRKKRPA